MMRRLAAGPCAIDTCKHLKAREPVFEKAKTFEREPRLAGFASRDLAFKISLEFGKRALEFVGSPHHLACLSHTFDRLFENVDSRDHGEQWAALGIVPAGLLPSAVASKQSIKC